MVQAEPSDNSVASDTTMATQGLLIPQTIPVDIKLVQLLRTLDSFSSFELGQVKSALDKIAEKARAEVKMEDADTDVYLQICLKLHQALALVDVDLSNNSESQDVGKVIQAIESTKGLEYCPREQTPLGRQMEHAMDTRALIKHLKTLPATSSSWDLKVEFTVAVGDKTEDCLFQIQRSYVELALNANGKAELYFHAYVWVTYIEALCILNDKDFNDLKKSSMELVRLQTLASKPKMVVEKIKSLPFGQAQYEKFVNLFGGRKQIKKAPLLQELQTHLFLAQISDDKQALKLIEKVLIQLLGYQDILVRDQAVILLNTLYDGVDWQMQSAFQPVIRCVGQHFKVALSIRYANFQKDADQIMIGLSAPSPLESTHDTVLTWHKIQDRNFVEVTPQSVEVTINFGKFWKCGFYDWRIVIISKEGKLSTPDLMKPPTTSTFPKSLTRRLSQDDFDDDPYDVDTPLAQGRFIVHARNMREHIFHEVQVDYQGAKVDFKNQSFTRRGTFEDVERSIDGYKESGVTALYLMGVFQRDNVPIVGNAYQSFVKENGSSSQYKKVDASPLAVTCRQTPCEMLGGKQGFGSLMGKARNSGVKVIVDCLARISSSRHHRKFKDMLLHYLDLDGRRRICYGTDGQANQYEDTAMLNYRKVEAWDLLVQEVEDFAMTTGVDGIHLDNGQAWPQIMELDMDELLRVDVDGEPAYTAEDIMNGEIVIRNENYGYWNTTQIEFYANPFFIKLCRQLWSKKPDFMIIGECWGGLMFEHRQIILSRSGVIPRLYTLPQKICSLFGKKLHRDGRITESEPEQVISLRKWYEDSRRCLPEGSIMMQSSTAHSWPYPAYLYGKGTWAAVDILYLMPDIPITFMGEVDGEVLRLGQTSVFQAEQKEAKSGTNLRRRNSQVMLALRGGDEEDTATAAGGLSIQKEEEEKKEEKKGLGVKVRSGSNLAAMVVEQEKAKQGQNIEQIIKQELKPDFGFDLSKIKSHYENRRMLRQQKMVLRYGELVPLVAKDETTPANGWLNSVLAFARYSLMETALIATNITDQTQKVYIDQKRLDALFSKTMGVNTVVITRDLLDDSQKPEYYFLKEFLTVQRWITLPPYGTSITTLTICQDDKFVIKSALLSSIVRTKEKLQNGVNIEAEQISQLLMDCLKNRHTDVQYFANLVGSLQENFLNRIHMGLNDLFLHNHALKNDPIMSSRLMALCKKVMQVADESSKDPFALARIQQPAQAAKTVYESNQLGPIVFCTPELGRWSTVGGLGVMVDELSLGLRKLGQEVIVISPYYDRNRKGVTGYLEKDPAGIEHVDNIQVQADKMITLGVHEGVVGGVQLAFLHHAEIFPKPYADLGAASVTRQLSVFAKACLEYCCKRGIIPSVCITNDWFTGMVAAYAKTGQFGPTFNGTTFMHICHNLQETYEGRIYPEPKDGYFEPIHGLPKECLVDPSWAGCVINPSRCAIMMSDQWSTVSKSYREDLLNSSPLAPLLSLKKEPFAYPNGIPIAERIKKLDAAAPDHITAKRMLQMKYFNYADLDDSVPLFAFVGRITQQKGVHLILDVAEAVIPQFNYKVQFLVGGPGNMADPYSAQCANRMWHLKHKYPNCFWAAPEEFFTDGALVNRGTDFGLMPSLFEPGGIVQHEFFVGATPVIAYKTGGLKDSVIEFMWDSEVGCGYTFEAYKKEDFIFAIQRAIGTYSNKQKYARLRQNAFNATMPGEQVCKAWLQEFNRLRGKVYTDFKTMIEAQTQFGPWESSMYEQINILDEMIGGSMSKQEDEEAMDDTNLGAEQSELGQMFASRNIQSEFDKIQRERVPTSFMLHNRGPRFIQVQICGSFDNWEKRHQMNFDHFTNQWFTNLHLPQGTYYYKYIVNGQTWVINEEERQEKDKAGNLNNAVTVQRWAI